MTENEVIQKINNLGHIKFVFEPNIYKKDLIEKKDLQNILEKTKISLRGWSFPHIPPYNTENDRAPYFTSNGIEFFIDSNMYKEIFRFYKSGQFVGKFILLEDIIDKINNTEVKPGKYLDFLSLIYKITEIVLFIKNIVENIGVDGGLIKLEINNTKNRELESIFNSMILPFNSNYICYMNQIKVEYKFEKEQILNDALLVSRILIKSIFNDFNWKNYSEEMIVNHQENLIKHRL